MASQTTLLMNNIVERTIKNINSNFNKKLYYTKQP